MRPQDLQITWKQPQAQVSVSSSLAFAKAGQGRWLNNEVAANKVGRATLPCSVTSKADPGIMEFKVGNMRAQDQVRPWSPESRNVDSEVRPCWGRPIGYINTLKGPPPFCGRSRRPDPKKIQDQLVIIYTYVDGVDVAKAGDVKRESERLLSLSYSAAANLNSVPAKGKRSPKPPTFAIMDSCGGRPQTCYRRLTGKTAT
ncbi:MAG: hypothetical protein MK133_09935, partial [Planctomycetes bacterium]|nr:hypothetical protein [Planctomycetota bacterium]